jgi:hypothetical protein
MEGTIIGTVAGAVLTLLGIGLVVYLILTKKSGPHTFTQVDPKADADKETKQ